MSWRYIGVMKNDGNYYLGFGGLGWIARVNLWLIRVVCIPGWAVTPQNSLLASK